VGFFFGSAFQAGNDKSFSQLGCSHLEVLVEVLNISFTYFARALIGEGIP